LLSFSYYFFGFGGIPEPPPPTGGLGGFGGSSSGILYVFIFKRFKGLIDKYTKQNLWIVGFGFG
jgi:hypothetical protein